MITRAARWAFLSALQSLSLAGNAGGLTGLRHSSRRSSATIAISVCGIFLCPNNGVAATAEICNVHTDADACDCTRGLYGHRERVCTESGLWEKNPLPHRGLKPASVLLPAFQSDALPSELSLSQAFKLRSISSSEFKPIVNVST